MVKAIYKDTIIAQSDQTRVVEGNHYFPEGAIDERYFAASETHTVCPWKGTASYYHVDVGGQRNADAAWYYPDPKPAAAEIRGYVAFWRGVQVIED